MFEVFILILMFYVGYQLILAMRDDKRKENDLKFQLETDYGYLSFLSM